MFKSELNAIHEYLESWSYFDWFFGALANENLQIADQPMRSLWADLTQRIPAKTKCFQNGSLWYFKPTKQLPLPLPVPSRLCTVLPLGCLSGCLLTRNPETSPGCTNKPQHDENWTAHAPITLVLHHCARPYRGPQGKDSKRETKPDMLFGKKRFLFWPHAWKHGQIVVTWCFLSWHVMANSSARAQMFIHVGIMQYEHAQKSHSMAIPPHPTARFTCSLTHPQEFPHGILGQVRWNGRSTQHPYPKHSCSESFTSLECHQRRCIRSGDSTGNQISMGIWKVLELN